MATVVRKEQLCSTEKFRDYFKSIQGLGSHTLFDRYDAIENVVNNKIDEKYRHFLAQPIVDGDSITWFSKPYKETPQQFSALQGEERSKYEQIKDDTIAHYNSVISSLKHEGKTSEAECLEKAIKFLDDDFVYCFDDKIVLGIWGMQLRNDVRLSLGIVMKNLFVTKRESPVIKEPIPEKTSPEPPGNNLEPLINLFTVRFNAGEGGNLNGISEFTKHNNEIITEGEVPKVESKEGYEFVGWDENPDGYEVIGNKEFTAQYRAKEIIPPDPPLPLPWYKRLWNWLRFLFVEKGCLKWLLWLLLLLLLLLLFGWLFKGCNRGHVAGGAALGGNDSTWINEDPRVGDSGGIYDPHNPYTPAPTPPGYEGVLPPQQGVLPPISDNPEIIPGNPSIIANRLNILMENENKSILELAKAFKEKYPGDQYKIVYYDDVIKRMQIEVPKAEREQLKQTIPGQFAPEYELFVFDEALFEGAYSPNDPAFSDPDKSWYLKAINAPQAWDITRGSEKITVAIVDNGFNLDHPELSGKVVQPFNVWKHSKEIFPQKIDHGTHVAGIALAIADNGKGLCGIAPNCKFMPIQVADARNIMTTTSVLDGILYALYQGADVVNVSLGNQFTGLSGMPENAQKDLIQNHFKEEERLWREVMRIAASHNATIVVAAGNDNVLAGIEALQRPELFITVSAVDKNNNSLNKASFSNYGQYATISAPGVGIYSSIGADGYQSMDGTSMAAPIVAGAVALMKSLNDSITTKQIICILRNTGLETQRSIGKLIQINKALEKVKSGEVIDCTKTPTTGDVQVLLSWNNYNDLDLICTDPSGESVFFKNPSISSGGQLEIDMNVEYPDSKKPIENIYWNNEGAPEGTYNVYLLYFKKHEPGINETPYTIKVKYGNKSEEYKGVIKKEDKPLHICTFTLGSTNNTPNPPNASPGIPSVQDGNKKKSLLQERERLQKELDRIERELRSIENRRQQ